MRVSVYLAVLLTAMVPLATGPIAARLAPARAATALAAAAVMAAVASTWGLLLLAATLLGGTSPVAEQAADRGVQLGEPVPAPVATVAALALAVGTLRVVRVLVARHRSQRELRAICSSSRSDQAGELVVVPLDRPHAFAVAGRPGRILVTSGMMRLLDVEQRRTVLAHERAHLHGRHHLVRAGMEVAAALNPVLTTTRDAVAFLVERAADEQAARTVGSRDVAARALVAVALWSDADTANTPQLAFHELAASQRVEALFQPPLPERRPVAAMVALLGLAAAVPAADATVAFVAFVRLLSPF